MPLGGKVITVTDLGLKVGTRWLFGNLSWNFMPGTVTAVLGPSGYGKTTLLGALAGLIRPTEGRITWEPGARIAWAQQNSPILAKRTALDNVALGAICAGIDDEMASTVAMRALAGLDLRDHTHTRAGRLSSGERQRVALARALAGGATVILADEPTASLDTASKQLVVQALRTAANEGLTVIVATHDSAVAAHADETLDLVDLDEPRRDS
jgi:ABC-type lipoprotein export system ATPase subunit